MSRKKEKGQSIVEILIIIGIISVLVGSAVGALIVSLRVNNQTEKIDISSSLAQELLDGARAISEGNWGFVYNLAEKSSTSTYSLITRGDCFDLNGGSENWNCSTGPDIGSAGEMSMDFDQSGDPWIAYMVGGTDTFLEVANYVGAGGNCSGGTWECTTVQSNPGVNIGEGVDIAFNASGTPWVSFSENFTAFGTSHNTVVAEYVGAGNGNGVCTSDAWSCTRIFNSTGISFGTSIGFDLNGNPWVTSSDAGNGSGALSVAEYVGSGGSGCYYGGTVYEWDCTLINTGGAYSSLAFGPSGDLWVAHFEDNPTGLIASYCVDPSNGCPIGEWSSVILDDTTGWGRTSIDINSSGNPWVVYPDSAVGLKVANYVGSGGDCTSSVWNCELVDGSINAQMPSIVIDSSDLAFVSYQDDVLQRIKVANYVGSGGDCTSSAWNCEIIDGVATNRVNSLAIDPSDIPFLGYQSTDISIAEFITSLLRIATGTQDISINNATYTRWFSVEDVSRDTNENVATTSATEDASTQKLTAYVQFEIGGKTKTTSIVEYITRFSRNNVVRFTDWSGSASTTGPITEPDGNYYSQSNLNLTSIGNISASVVIVSDDFNRAQANDLGSYWDVDFNFQSSGSTGWETDGSSQAFVDGNPTDLQRYARFKRSIALDGWAEVQVGTVINNGTYPQIGVNYRVPDSGDSMDGYIVMYDKYSGKLIIRETSGGLFPVRTSLSSGVAYTLTDGDYIGISVIDNVSGEPVITSYLNGVQQETYTDTVKTHTTGSSSGLFDYTGGTDANPSKLKGFRAGFGPYPGTPSSGSSASGTLISSTYDTGFSDGVKLNSIMWLGDNGTGGTNSVKFQVASSNCANGATDKGTCVLSVGWGNATSSPGEFLDGAFVGPGGGSTNDYYNTILSQPVIVSTDAHEGKRYFRYLVKIDHDASSTSPVIEDIILNISP